MHKLMNICCKKKEKPIDELYIIIGKCIEKKGKDIGNYLNRTKKILDKITIDELMENGKTARHPILHEVCHQYSCTFELIKIMWHHPKLKNLWNNPDYIDEYGNTVTERMARTLSHINKRYITREEREELFERHHVQWFCTNMGIVV